MFQLAQKRKEQAGEATPVRTRVGLRDLLLTKEVQEAIDRAESTCRIDVPDPDKLYRFRLIVTPDEGYWKGGQFVFLIVVPEEYNISAPKCTCETKIWHPNIAETGEVCLSILRDSQMRDGHGWLPTRSLKDVVWGINSLFTDLLNFEDPLNIEAGEMHTHNKDQFARKVRQYIAQYATEKVAASASATRDSTQASAAAGAYSGGHPSREDMHNVPVHSGERSGRGPWSWFRRQ